ncbi:hypothetical protein AB0J82_36840 [Asanoa sp. NPDC049518]|uniref:hypothetical protein n=1 Tax=unclassified Asanoa TaxID=2685164 RepID=UPI00342B3110
MDKGPRKASDHHRTSITLANLYAQLPARVSETEWFDVNAEFAMLKDRVTRKSRRRFISRDRGRSQRSRALIKDPIARHDDRQLPYYPGAVSWFFASQAGLCGAACWTWLAILASAGGPVTGWQLFAAAAGTAFIVTAVVLGVRIALQAAAALRHAEVKKLLVEISWNTEFSAQPAGEPDNVVRFPAAVGDDGDWPIPKARGARDPQSRAGASGSDPVR